MSPVAPATQPRALAGIVIVWLYAFLPANLIPTIIGRLVTDFEVDVTTAGLIATGMTLLNSATVLAVRPIVRRGRRAGLATAGAGILIAVSIIGMFVQSGAVISALLLVAGVGSGLALATASAALSATDRPERSANIAMIFNRLVVAVAYFLVPVLGTSMLAIFLILCIPGFAVLFTARWLPGAPEPTTSETGAAGAGRMAWVLAASMGLLAITDDGIIGMSELVGIAFFGDAGSPLVLRLYAIATLAGLGGALVAPLLLKRLGQTTTLALSIVLSLAGKLVILLVPDTTFFSIGYLAWGFAFGLCLPVIFGLAAALRPDGSASVAVNGVYVLGVALGPTVAAYLFDNGGASLLAWTMGAVGVVSAALMLGVSLRATRDADDLRRGATAAESSPVPLEAR